MKSAVRRVFLIVIAIGVVLGSAWVVRQPLLHTLAQLWVVSDPLERADAIVILGGGVDTRPFAAANLYERGFAKQILLADVRLSPVEKLGVTPRHRDLHREVLVKLGVPAEAIATFGDGVSNTYEEARALRAWAEASTARSVIIPTEIFPSRRVRWVFGRELAQAGVRVQLQALAPLEYSVATWWQHEQGIIGFQNEILKYLYYRVKY